MRWRVSLSACTIVHHRLRNTSRAWWRRRRIWKGSRLPSLRYIHEPLVGLSHTRNLAVKEVSIRWVICLDDDAVVLDGYSQRLGALVSEADLDHIVEVILPWHRGGYGPNAGIGREYGALSAGPFASGNARLFRLAALRSVGWFNTELGMARMRRAYGGETRAEIATRLHGYRVGLDPQWREWHHVLFGKHD